MTTVITTPTTVADSFGSGGSNLAPSGAGTPTLAAVLQEIQANLVLLDTNAAALLNVLKKTVTIGHADLTDSDDGDPQAFNIGTALPANARIVGVDMRVHTAFTGGGASALTCDVGTSGDVDALVDGADLFAAAVDGGPSTMPPGIRPNKTFITAAAQLIATLTPDVSTNGTDFTAGAVTIDVLYVVLA